MYFLRYDKGTTLRISHNFGVFADSCTDQNVHLWYLCICFLNVKHVVIFEFVVCKMLKCVFVEL